MTPRALSGRDLGAYIEQVDTAPMSLMAVGREVCPACQMLDASLAVIADARPDLPVYVVNMNGDDDWAVREPLLWPRGIRVSRAATPAIALLRNGRAVATRQGALPASQLDTWIAGWFGPAARPVADGIAEVEQAVLDRTAARRAQHTMVKER